MRTISRTMLAALMAAILFPAGGARAQVQSEAQRRCIVDMNRKAASVAKARGVENGKCVMAAAKGKLGARSAQQCVTEDSVKRVADARIALLQTQADSCDTLPDFGFGGAEAAFLAAFEEEVALVGDLAGDPLDDAIGSMAVAKCQRSILKAADRTVQATLRTFSDCKDEALTDPTLVSSAALADRCFAAVETDASGRITKAKSLVVRSLGAKCAPASVPLPRADIFPGVCAAAPDFAACVESSVACRSCRMLAGMDALDTDCDLFDNGTLDASCETPAPPTTTTSTTSTTTTTTSTTTTTVDPCNPGPDCSSLDEECRLGVCNPLNGACTFQNVGAGASCSAGAAGALIANFAVTDLGSADDLLDAAAGDVHEWAHSIAQDVTATGATARLAGAMGADACCTVEDESITKTVAWRVSFDVVSAGDWRLDLGHVARGAFSILDEKVALEDAGASTSISAVAATVAVDGGAPLPFGFTPSPASRTHALNGGEGSTDTPFSGSAAMEIPGTGNASVVLEFSFTLTATSNSNAAVPAAGGDEAAIRFGRADGITNGFTAGAYPSGNAALASRDAALDGHTLTVRLVSFACLGAGECDGSGSCVAAPPVECGSLDAECTVGVCDEGTQSCVAEATADGGACDDGDLCTVGDACASGACEAGTPTDCSGLDDACNDGACDAGTGNCIAAPKTAGTVCSAPAAGAVLSSVLLTDLSTADSKVDTGAGDVREWNHATSIASGLDSIEASLKGMIGADACCTVEDETASATAAYRIAFDIAATAPWELEIGHDVLGAFSLLDEKVALEDAGGSATIGLVGATVAVDGGAPTSFGFNASPSSRTHALNGGEGDSDVPFSGAASTTLAGSGNASVVLEFSFALTAFSNSNAAVPAAGGDEVAIRLGRSDTIATGFTAGQYPSGDASLASRDIAADGHFVHVRLRTATCDGEATCDGSGNCSGGSVDCGALDDECGRGICDADTASCVYEPFAAGVSCSDGNACNGSETCDGAGSCSAGTAVDCSGLDDQCNDGVCDTMTGMCSAVAKTDGTSCNDGDACSDTDICTAGTCDGTTLAGCGATITGVSLADLSTADTKVDGVAGDVREWGHTTGVSSTDTTIAANLKGIAGADACCTVEDETQSATPRYRVSFSVVSSRNWELTLANNLLGAFSLLDEKVALEDAGGSGSVTAVTATATVNGGSPTAFGFTPSPTSRTHALNGGEGDSDVQFSGSNQTVIAGSGNASVVVEIQFGVTAFSNSNAFVPAAGGDEVAVRFGKADTIANGFTAGGYPSGDASLAARSTATDGHFLAVSVIGLP